MFPPRRIQPGRVSWLAAPLRWLPAVIVVLTCLLGTIQSGTDAGSPSTIGGVSEYLEEATPDTGPVPDEPFPARKRAEHFAQLGVDHWQALGYLGQGVKIAILDSGFRGYRDHLGKALPQGVMTRSFRTDGNLEAKDSKHGILCGEVLHALAPRAELLLANWDPDRPDQFLAAARWARQQGARIISCSVIMPSWSDGEGGGAVNEALTELIGPANQPSDMLCFASAGNTAMRHWTGSFHPDPHGYHQWQQGQMRNLIAPWGTEVVSVELYAQPGARYALEVQDAATGAVVGHSVGQLRQDRSTSVVHFRPTPGNLYQVQVRLNKGQEGKFHLVVLGGGLSYATHEGSVSFPADNPKVIAVGAVNHDGKRASYSSCGPNSRQPKPDLVATVPFPSLWRPRPFSGTSAAAPQAAGLAALCWSRHPEWTADQVHTFLRVSAHDLGPAGHDCETGYGLIAMPTNGMKSQSSSLQFSSVP